MGDPAAGPSPGIVPAPTPEVPPRCPICGETELADVAFDLTNQEERPTQSGDSREVVTFACGHEVVGARLDSADADALDVERRTSDETARPG